MNLQSFLMYIKDYQHIEIENTDSYLITKITEPNWVGTKYVSFSIIWGLDYYSNSLEESKQWVEFVNSKNLITSRDIYNSKVIYETTNIPKWLEEQVELGYCDLEDVTQDKIVICTHIRKPTTAGNYIEISSIKYNGYPIAVVTRNINDKDGANTEIFITNKEGYNYMINYLYQFKIDKVTKDIQYPELEDISLVWGYFTEDLLKETA
jgi:hypothetical protein